MTDSWESISSTCQSAVRSSIPERWRLQRPPDASVTDVRDIPRTCGLLTPAQLEITELTTGELVTKLHTGSLTAVEATEAFCARAAIAHQCVCVDMLFCVNDGRAILSTLLILEYRGFPGELSYDVLLRGGDSTSQRT